MSLVNVLIASSLQHGVHGLLFFNKPFRYLIKHNHTEFMFICYVLKTWTCIEYLGHMFLYSVDTTLFEILTGFFLVFYGVYLNYKVHGLLGATSIYYGHELGIKRVTKWITDFPYSIMKDPQYVGTMLQYIGVSLMFYRSATELRWDVIWSCFYLCSLYQVTILIEKRKMT
jgi:methylene-fatty-acyl-phospholipid synthase